MTDKALKQSDSAEKPAKRRGRKPVVTEEVIDRVCQYMTVGHYTKTALSLVGIRESTWYNAIQRAEKAKRPTRLQTYLLESIRAAEARYEHYHVQIVNAAQDPRISLEMLARRFPDRWAPSQKNVNTNRNVDKDGNDIKPPAVLRVPGIMDETEWAEAAQRYKELQPKVEEPADGDSVH